MQLLLKIHTSNALYNTTIFNCNRWKCLLVLPASQPQPPKQKEGCLAISNSILLLKAEILHQLIGSLSHCLQGFIHPKWCRISAINSINTKQICSFDCQEHKKRGAAEVVPAIANGTNGTPNVQPKEATK